MQLKFLFLNTVSEKIRLALFDGKKVLVERVWKGDRDELKRVLANLEEMLFEVGLRILDLEGMAVVVGPGPYSSVRIAASLANGLKFALGIRLVEIENLEGSDLVEVARKKILNGEFVEQIRPLYIKEANITLSKNRNFIKNNCYLCFMLSLRRLGI